MSALFSYARYVGIELFMHNIQIAQTLHQIVLTSVYTKKLADGQHVGSHSVCVKD